MQALLLAALAVTAQGQDEKLEAEAKRRLAEFNKAIAKATSDDEINAALKGLDSTRHPKILAELKKWGSHDSAVVRTQAVALIAAYAPGADALKALLSILSKENSRAMYDETGRPSGHETPMQILDMLAVFEIDDSTLKTIHASMQHKIPMIANAAVRQVARLKRTESVDPLIALLRSLESLVAPQPSVSGGAGTPGFVKGGNSGGPSGPDAWSAYYRKQQMPPEVHSALTSILGEKKADAAEYQKVWGEMKKRKKEEK